jgi:Ca2+-binding RTX toxin-like protein
VVDPDVTDGTDTYIVQKGDSLWKIAVTNGWDFEELKTANPQLSDPNFIRIGQKINGLAPAATTDHFTLATTPDVATAEANPDDPATFNGLLAGNATYSLYGIGDVNALSGNTAYANNTIAGWRPGAYSLVTEILASQLADNFLADPNLASSPVWNPEVTAAALQMLATGVATTIPTDPLILDLNGDGVKLTSFADAPVLFDIDHDGGSKEVTGWVSAEDGIVVMDLNNNGQIDGIHETMSEYFNGEVGAGGTAGSKPYANGFAALASLDSDADNAFTVADAAWTNVKVWQDADHDGITDANELKTLAELNITRIDLTPTPQSGLVNGGNEILASGTFVQNGIAQEAQAARFIANAVGNTATVSASGTTVSAEDGQSTYVSSVTTGETIDVATVVAGGVKNAYGNSGNDVLIGDANANWLVGGQGSDTFNAGAGDDMLIVDAADLQANIHAGDGFDMVQVVGQEGVTLNLAQAEVEVAVGGTGDDIVIGGGRSSVFIRSGDGDDIVIGGAASDALSGENGADLIDGGAGNDIVRGGRGSDQLMGGTGDDLVFAGQDDDRIEGGTGNDVLRGEQGDDTIDGGEGTDIAEFSGSFSDYRITRLTDTSYRVVDTQAGRDGADILTNIEKLNFADVSAVDITLDNPLPVKDVITLANRVGMKLIKVSDLLANDSDWQGDALHITTISDIKGGTLVGSYNATTKEWTPTLTANGELQFTPDPAYTGVMSFKYKIADADGTPGATAYIAGTTTQAEMRGEVFLVTPDMPTDSLFTEQWYLNDINVLPVWQDAYGQGYTGKGVTIAQFEPGMPFSTGPEAFDYRHPDLQGSVDPAWIADPDNDIPQSFSQHATLVAGVMVAARDGKGAVGVAYDAKLSGHYIQGTGLEVEAMTQEVTNAVGQFKNYDVVNNSWGATADFAINLIPVGLLSGGIHDAVTQGRNGLGTAVVFAAGNDRANGGNSNYSALTDNRATIVTGAINAESDISTLTIGQAPFSNPGASILVSAPGSNVASTSQILMGDDGTIFGSDTAMTQGTSLAAPIVSGVVALMLEANPNLGYRDIQQILAISARQVKDLYTDQPNRDQTVDLNAAQFWNDATNWNGGGMHTSHDYGFGEVDARAAVRLAETWVSTRISDNERHLGKGEGSMNGAANLGVVLNNNIVTRTLAIGAGVRVEHVTVSLDVTHSNWGDLTVELISPTGTVSKLIANPGTSATNPGGDVGTGQLTFALDTTHDYGENAQGNWQLRITDRSGLGTGTLNGWKVDVYGSDLNETNSGPSTAGETPIISATGNNQYFYTNEFATAPDASRATLTDGNGGLDILNAAAVSSNSTINLNNGSASIIAGRSLTINVNSNIENAIGGDGNDTLTGNALDNRLLGGRGNDVLSGGNGNDILDGGQGSDTLSGGAGSDFFAVRDNSGADTVTDFVVGVDRLVLAGMDTITPGFSQVGADTLVSLGTASVLLKNVAASSISASSLLHAPADVFRQLLDMTLPGSDGNDTLYGTTGGDRIYGGAGDDLLVGDTTNTGPGNADIIDGGAGNDEVIGGAGGDTLVGGAGADYVQGDAGNDVIYLEGDYFGDVNAYGSNARVEGNAGADRFLLTQTTAGQTYSNFVWDFEVGTAGSPIDIIDLSQIAQARSFAQLNISGNRIGAGGEPITEIYVIDDPLNRVVTLFNVTWSQLRAEHFAFAPQPTTINPIISGTAGNNALTGDAGGNTLDGGAGADTMTGRTGDDSYIVDNAGDTVIELPDGGFDTVRSSVSYTLAANVENLVLTDTAAINGTGNDDANRITGNSASNILDGGAGVDALLGGAGDDAYVVDSQADSVIEHADEGTDTVSASVSYVLGNNIENLTLTGAESVNATGNALANTLAGNAGDNLLDGANGADSMAGGLGDDTYFVDNAGDMVTENANEGIDTVYAAVDHTLGAEVENLVLTYGTTAGNGNALDNWLAGNSAANTLNGAAGDDVLDGGAGADTLIGGVGNDAYVVDNAGDVVTENSGEGTDLVQASVSYTLAANVENLYLTGTAAIDGTGNDSDNVLTGNAAANILSGGSGADTLIGRAGDDTYVVDDVGDVVVENAGEGTDLVQASISYALSATVENLTLTGTAAINGTGNESNNVLTGNVAANTLTGGAGDDTYVVDNAGDVVVENADEGTDLVQASASYTLSANVENLTLIGSGAINGTGNTLDNVLTGNAAANILNGGTGTDTLIGGGGNDIYVVDDATDVVTENTGAGTDLVQTNISYTLGSNIENLTLTGTAAIDGTGNTLNNILTGNAADNILNGGTGADTMIGGAGNDTYVVDSAGDRSTEYSGEGIDFVQASTTHTLAVNVENLTLTGTYAISGTGNNSNNILTGNAAVNTLTGNAGNDTLDGGAGADRMFGGTGNDIYVVDNASDSVTEYGGEGADTVLASVTEFLSAYVENLTLIGTAAINGTGNDSNNVLIGNAAANTLNGGYGADTMQGGAGDDTYVVYNDGDLAIENADEGTDLVQAHFSYTLSANVENLTLAGGAVNGAGNALANVLTGNDENNTLTGGAGNDTLDGGSWGADRMLGGAGDDTYVVDYANDVVTENAGEGSDLVRSAVTWTLGANLENLTLTGTAVINGTGNTLANVLTGNAVANILNGGIGADTMVGGAGDDTYVVTSGGDVVTENADEGIDLVQADFTYTLGANVENLTLAGTAAINGTGNTLDNVLTGNAANNTLTGGAGNDTYVVENAGDVVVENAGEGTDVVQSSVTWTLGAHLENLTLTGTAAINGTGNTLDNVLTGNSATNILSGGAGNDTYVVDNTSDVVVENAGQGIDLVQSSVTRTLGAHFENLTLIGTAEINGTGNSLDNVLIGNAANNSLVGGAGNDIVDGGTGADTLRGGTGDDTYVVNSTGDWITEYGGEGTDLVLASISYSLSTYLNDLTLTGTAAINGTGNKWNNLLSNPFRAGCPWRARR